MTATTALTIPAGDHTLAADLALPENPRGLVIFAHGSGSSRASPRNLHVASRLHAQGFGTLLFDLLTPAEQRLDERTRHLRFDVALLATRLGEATRALTGHPDLPPWRGYFGASTGAAAALIAAAAEPATVDAIVSRGGRPDLAGDALENVRSPTLLIVGGDDTQVLALNELALRRLRCVKSLALVQGATHLFEEPGTLDEVCDLAAAWFDQHCPHPSVARPHGATRVQRRHS